MRENLAATFRLMLVTDDALVAGRDVVALCRAAVRGGATIVQLRLKLASDNELFRLTQSLVAELSVPLIVNDRLDIALAGGAAGVHLGPDDLPPVLARRIVPPSFIIGASVGSPAEAERGAVADYWGIGPLHQTGTKADAGAALGLEGARSLLVHAGGRPCVAIGGVTPDDVPPLHDAGFAGVAVVSGILRETDIEVAARRFTESS